MTKKKNDMKFIIQFVTMHHYIRETSQLRYVAELNFEVEFINCQSIIFQENTGKMDVRH